MKYTTLGKTGLRISQICMGCWAIGGDQVWGLQEDSDSIRTIHAAIEMGINFFDTAEVYANGRSEEVLGKAVSERREDVIIGTKVNSQHLSESQLRQACETSLRRLQTDYIDLYHIHFSNPRIPISETLKILEKLREEGKIRVIGVSNFGRNDLHELLTLGYVEVNQLPYSLLWRAIEYEILPFCVQNNVGITCYGPLAQGLLTGKFRTLEEVPLERARTRHFSGKRAMARHGGEGAELETFSTIEAIRCVSRESNIPMVYLALKWLLTREGVISVIVGARDPDQIRNNARAVNGELPPSVVTKLTEVTEELKHKLGHNADMWESDSESRIR